MPPLHPALVRTCVQTARHTARQASHAAATGSSAPAEPVEQSRPLLRPANRPAAFLLTLLLQAPASPAPHPPGPVAQPPGHPRSVTPRRHQRLPLREPRSAPSDQSRAPAQCHRVTSGYTTRSRQQGSATALPHALSQSTPLHPPPIAQPNMPQSRRYIRTTGVALALPPLPKAAPSQRASRGKPASNRR
jgi:hypothetical protein